MKLSEYAHGRDNNFNLIRFIAALAVLCSHSITLAIGHRNEQPLLATYGVTLGDIAVNVFFLTSGFLVSGSLFSRRSSIAFAWARVLRIWPALLVMLIVVVFGVGLSMTTVSPHAYLTSGLTWDYFGRNALLFTGVSYWLPGLFVKNPWNAAVNGSLWTLPSEVNMYAALLALWLVAKLWKNSRELVFQLAIVGIMGLAGFVYIHERVFESDWHLPRFAFMFFTGAVYYCLRDRIELSKLIALAAVAAIIISLLRPGAFFLSLNLLLPYVLFCGAYMIGGRIRSFNRLGDYSYGIYIYAWPVQQFLADKIRPISIPLMIAASAAITMALAALSWHLVEKRALGLKGVCAGWTESLLRTRRFSVAGAVRRR